MATPRKIKKLTPGELCLEKQPRESTVTQINTPSVPIQIAQQNKQHPEFHLHLHFPSAVPLPLEVSVEKPFEVNVQISQVQSNIMSHVTSTSAVQTARNCYIFFVQPDDQLGYMKGPNVLKKPDKQDAKPYRVYTISHDSNAVSVNKASTQVAALAYTQNGTVQIRLYYIDSNSQLAELCTSETDAGLAPWTEGSLNDAAYSADPKTMLTAAVDSNGGGQLKLYYQKKLDGFMWCTWVTTGNTAWNQQEINSRWEI